MRVHVHGCTVNFQQMLDARTRFPQVLEHWDASWTLTYLATYVKGLMSEPDPGLIPPDYAHGTRLDHSAMERAAGVDPPGYDLRPKKTSNKILAEIVHERCLGACSVCVSRSERR